MIGAGGARNRRMREEGGENLLERLAMRWPPQGGGTRTSGGGVQQVNQMPAGLLGRGHGFLGKCERGVLAA